MPTASPLLNLRDRPAEGVASGTRKAYGVPPGRETVSCDRGPSDADNCSWGWGAPCLRLSNYRVEPRGISRNRPIYRRGFLTCHGRLAVSVRVLIRNQCAGRIIPQKFAKPTANNARSPFWAGRLALNLLQNHYEANYRPRQWFVRD